MSVFAAAESRDVSELCGYRFICGKAALDPRPKCTAGSLLGLFRLRVGFGGQEYRQQVF